MGVTAGVGRWGAAGRWRGLWRVGCGRRRLEANRGAVAVSGTADVELSQCTLQGNEGAAEGGAVHQSGGRLVLRGCALQHNRALRRGGALLHAGGTLVLADRTFLAANRAPAGGGATAWSAGGTLAYALPAPAGRWVASAFLCQAWRQPCPAAAAGCEAVSYTHLTLPTICSV